MPLFGPPNVKRMTGNLDIVGLISAFEYEKDHGETREAAIESLALIGERAEPFLIDALNEKNALVRAAAAMALGKMKSGAAIEPIGVLLRDSEDKVRLAAAKSLGYIASKGSLSFLSEAVLKEDQIDVVKAMIDAIASHRMPEAVKPLIQIIEGDDHRLRIPAAEALASVGETAVEKLISALKFGSRNVRLAALRALEEIGDDRSIQPLVVALADEDEYIELAAREALRKFGAPAMKMLVAALQTKNQSLLDAVVLTLVKLGDDAQDALIAGLRSGPMEMKELILRILGNIHSSWSEQVLISALRASDDSLRYISVIGLGTIGNKDAVSPLLGLLHDPSEYISVAVSQSLDKIQARITDIDRIEEIQTLIYKAMRRR